MKKHSKDKAGTGNWRALFRTIGKLRLSWVWIIIAVALNFVLMDLMLKLPDTTANLMGGELTALATTEAIMYYVVLGLMSFAMVAGQVQAQAYCVKKARQTMWKKMLDMKMDYYDRRDPSDLMSTISNDISSAILSFTELLIYFPPVLYYVIMAMVRINEYHWILTASCFAMIPLKFLYAWIMGRKMHTSTMQMYGRIGSLTGFLADRINHLSLIKAYTNEEQELKNGDKASGQLLKANMKIVHLSNISTGILAVIDILQKFIVVVVAVILLQQGKIDITMWLAFFLFAQNLFPYMDQVIDVWVRAKGMQGNFQRVIQVMDGEEEVYQKSEALPFPETGDICFKNITFTYPETEKPAITDASFSVKRGSSLAIVGLCGSGKTTAVSLLERFYNPEEGEILIGDTNIKDISLSDFRKKFSYVQQGADVFSGTLRDALTYGIDRAISDEEILAAAEKTGFNEYLSLCGEGLDKEISSGGVSMSGGQSQRLVITRELLRGGEIILMDEPTSALDVRISVKIQSMMDNLFADKTRILITHDLKFAKKYNRIIVMDGGKVVGDGTHETLLTTCSLYREMIENSEKEEAMV